MSLLRRLKILLGLKRTKSAPPFVTIGRATQWWRRSFPYPAREDCPIEIGSFCSLADGVYILSGISNHRVDTVSTKNFGNLFPEVPSAPIVKGPTVIGSDVWIGRNAIILPGLKIGHGAVVGAGAVVTKDVPPYAIVAGNPAKVLRRRFDDEIVEALLKIEWWNWTDEKIRSYKEYFLGSVEDFVAVASSDVE